MSKRCFIISGIVNISGNFVRSLGLQGTSQGDCFFPCDICFHNNRNIFVADTYNHRICIFNEEGKFTGMFGGKRSRDRQLSCPLGLDSDGNMILVD